MIVADPNLIVALCVKTENTALASAILKRDREWIAPPLWESEFRNAMLAFIRAKKLNISAALSAFQIAASAVQTMHVSSGAVLRIAENYGISAYDAEYAALSEWIECPLLSFDSDLLTPGLASHPSQF